MSRKPKPASTKTVRLERERAHQRYIQKDGTEVPGVTTILGVMAKPALIKWAWEQGRKGLDYRKVSTKAADIGTIAHFLVECHLKGVTPDLQEFAPADVKVAKGCFQKFMGFWKESGLTFEASECQLVSEIYPYGGTLDIIARDSRQRPVLVDIKTSKGIYEEYWYQVAAYSRLAQEKLGLRFQSVVICRIGKDDGEFEHEVRQDLSHEWKVFCACLQLRSLLHRK